jgi:general stress protein YciG
LPKKNPAAAELGRRGGRVLAKKLSKEAASEIGRKAAEARWAKVKDQLGDTNRRLEKPLKARESRLREVAERDKKAGLRAAKPGTFSAGLLHRPRFASNAGSAPRK